MKLSLSSFSLLPPSPNPTISLHKFRTILTGLRSHNLQQQEQQQQQEGSPMAMAMGVASLAMTAGSTSKLVTPRAGGSASNTGEKRGFLDWFRTALDKESLSETDAVLAKVNESAKSNGKAAAAPKKVAAAPKKAGFNFFGKK